MSELDTSNWSGEGKFTQLLIDRLCEMNAVALVKVEDAPATRSEADYNFISNEVYVRFATEARTERVTRLGFLPGSRQIEVPLMTVSQLEHVLTAIADIGEPDYADDGMLQYLKTERIIPPYQTRGYKLVELVRVYEAGTPRRD
ncbi:MAG: hypothetical protein AB7F99_11180 [Vicinamibacterales bacterium]